MIRCLVLGLSLSLPVVWAASSNSGPTDHLSREDALEIVRSLNTIELDHFLKLHKYVSRPDAVKALKTQSGDQYTTADRSDGKIKDYTLSLITSEDGKQYTLALTPEHVTNDCPDALFSNESGIIYMGKPLDCAK